MSAFVAGIVHVTYYSQHAGHKHDISHQQLSREQRVHIAGMMTMGIPFDDILDRVQLSGNSTRLSRRHLVNKQDLKNIARDFNISKGQRICANDADSVAAWVEANRQDGDHCLVRYVKFQGSVDTDRNLRSNDFCLVNISEAQIVYKTLRALLEITDKEVFNNKLQEFIESAMTDDRTVQFAEYFHREYASRPQLWAYCHRLGLKVHHNMHLEALHRVLKHVHMNGRKVRRMDSCIHALMKLMRMKMRDRLQKLHKGKWTRHVQGIRMRHRKGMLLDNRLLTEVEPNRAYIVQGRDKAVAYMVEQSDTVPHETMLCPLVCRPCGVCIHTFVCNCVDFGIRNTICKHIHAVVSVFKPVLVCTPASQELSDDPVAAQTIPATGSDSEAAFDDDNIVGLQEQVVSVTSRQVKLAETASILDSLVARNDNTTEHYISEAEGYWSRIRAQMTDNVEVAAAACDQLKRVEAYLSALKQKPQLPQLPLVHEPVNKKLPQQRFFASTKKAAKKRNREETLIKPDSREKAFLLETLTGNVELVSTASAGDDDIGPGVQVAFEHSY